MNVSDINSLESLHKAMHQLKGEIAQQENQLAQKVTELPRELLGAAGSALLPVIVQKFITYGGWKLLKLAVNLFYTFRKKRSV